MIETLLDYAQRGDVIQVRTALFLAIEYIKKLENEATVSKSEG